MQENDYSLYDYIKPILSATFISVLSIAILTFILSLALTKIDLPFGMISPISIIIIGLSNFIGSFIGAKKFGKKGLFIGFSASIALFIIILLKFRLNVISLFNERVLFSSTFHLMAQHWLEY